MPSSQPSLSRPKYRPDIDGLRAIAVLSVVAFHAFPKWVKGGFIGVDVFFVISGYLISTLIFENLEKGTFSFAEFYARRIKRIFPALLLVLIACYTFGWYTLLAAEYSQLGKHIAAGAGFVSNIVLWNEAGYFDNASETKPLLHLWSLGIEEQFYIVWPVLIWAAWKRKFNTLTIIILIALVSFYLNVRGIGRDTVATFFSPHTRFWELLCGSVLAWTTIYKIGTPGPRNDAPVDLRASAVYREKSERGTHTLPTILSFLGLFLLAFGLWRIDKSLAFPGTWAMVPVLSAVLIITAGPRAWVNRKVLSNPIAVWFGLISFPLYLWHWPLLSFARITESDMLNSTTRIAAILISVVLAWITYSLVEKPIRQSKHRLAKAADLLLLMLVVGYGGYYIYRQEGLGSRFPQIVQELIQYKYDYTYSYRLGSCFLRPDQDYKEFEKCESGTLRKGKTILLWGDSHAAHLYPGYKSLYGSKFNILQRTASACRPFIGVKVANRTHCKEINNNVIAFVQKEMPDRVVLAANWKSTDLSKFDETVAQLKKVGIKNIDLIGPVPKWRDGLPKQLYRYYMSHIPRAIPYRMSFGLDRRFLALDDVLEQKARTLKINYFSPKNIFCDINGCITRLGETGETLTAWDSGHLTTMGSEFLVSKFPEL